MKYFHVAVMMREDDKFYAYGIRISSNDNVISKLAIKNIYAANICETGKKCDEIVKLWNNSFSANGTYFFKGGSSL